MANTEVLNIRIEPELKQKISQAAKKKGLKSASYVKMVLTEAVERDNK